MVEFLGSGRHARCHDARAKTCRIVIVAWGARKLLTGAWPAPLQCESPLTCRHRSAGAVRSAESTQAQQPSPLVARRGNARRALAPGLPYQSRLLQAQAASLLSKGPLIGVRSPPDGGRWVRQSI